MALFLWQSLLKLRLLDVSWNELTNWQGDTAVLRKHMPALQSLEARHNPWTKVGVCVCVTVTPNSLELPQPGTACHVAASWVV